MAVLLYLVGTYQLEKYTKENNETYEVLYMVIVVDNIIDYIKELRIPEVPIKIARFATNLFM